MGLGTLLAACCEPLVRIRKHLSSFVHDDAVEDWKSSLENSTSLIGLRIFRLCLQDDTKK